MTDERQPSEEPPPEKVAAVGYATVAFMPDGALNLMMDNARIPQLWAASRLLDTVATRMWNQQRDAALSQAQSEADEIDRVRRAIAGRPRGRQS